MDRREFLQKTSCAAGAVAAQQVLGGQAEGATCGGEAATQGCEAAAKCPGKPGCADPWKAQKACGAGKMPQRPYKHGGPMLSIIGFGGIVVMNADQPVANRAVARAVEAGINYFDVAPTYGDAEIKLGPALEPFREGAFLACKTHQRDSGPAREELKRSFERLRTDHFDLYQLHGIVDVEKDVDRVFAKGGAMEPILEAKKDGRIRYLGFSAHTEEAALAAMDRYDFDSVLFPINFCTWYAGRFGHRVVARAQEKGMAILALKSLAKQQWPQEHPQRKAYGKCWYEPLTEMEQIRLAVSFTLSQPVVAALPPGEEALFWKAVEVGQTVQPLTAEQDAQLQSLATGLNPIFERPTAAEA